MKINIIFVCKEFPLQDVSPQKRMDFSVDFSKLATGGVARNFVEIKFVIFHEDIAILSLLCITLNLEGWTL